MPIDEITIVKLSICSRKVAWNTRYSTIIVIISILVEYVNARVLFYTIKWPFTYSKKRGLHLFPFIQVLNFWVPERACVIYNDKKKLYVLKFEYIKGSVIKG